MTFTIVSTDFPATSTTAGYGTSAGLVAGSAGDGGSTLATYQQFQNPELEAELFTPLPVFSSSDTSISVTTPTTSEGYTCLLYTSPSPRDS